MKPLLCSLCLLLFQRLTLARGDDGDETLRGWLAQAELVVTGTITNEPVGITHETGVPNYLCDFKVAEVIKGDATLTGKTIPVNIVRFELAAKDQSPLVKKDTECILFLKNVGPDKPVWQTVDVWFGVQQRSPWLARSLKRLASEKWERPPGRDGQPVATGRSLPQAEELFDIQCQRAEDQIVAGKEDFGQTLTVTCPRGIGRATIALRAAAWPNPLKFRFNLKGLEGLTVFTGKGKPHELSHRDDIVKRVDGGFEVAIPRDWLGEDVKSLAVQWVDFYR